MLMQISYTDLNRHIISEMAEILSEAKVSDNLEIRNKATGTDGIPAELY